MKVHLGGRAALVAAVVSAVAVVTVGFLIALGVHTVVAGPGSAPAAAPANPGHPYTQIDLPGGTWTGLDADLLDTQHGAYYRDATNINAGTLGTAYYSAYSDLTAEGYLGDAAGDLARNNGTLQSTLNADLLDGFQASDIMGRLGFSTTTVDSAGVVGQYASVTVGTDGLPFLSYYDDTNDELKVLHCGNAACTSGNTITPVDSAGVVGLYSSVTVGADGLPFISYYDDDNDDLKVAHCSNPTCSASTITPVDSTGVVGLYSSVTVGADGLPFISYYDDDSDDLKVAHCSNPTCSASTITRVDSTNNVGQYSSVTVGADGLPFISYYDGSTVDLKVLHCGQADCSASNIITRVDSATNVGTHTSVAVGSDGLPLISYYDSTVANRDLKVLHCGNLVCDAGNTITTIDGADEVGTYTSVTIGADGLPLISYYDSTNTDLKVAHCGNVACTASTTITVDGVGMGTSVTVGADGLPFVGYRDSSANDLKVAHCSNRFCVPYHRPR